MLPRRIGHLGRNTIYTSVALGLRAVVLAAYLVLLSRAMGPGEYGLFAGSVAVAVLLAPLAGWGVSMLVSERVGKRHEAARGMWAGALAQIAWTGGLLAIATLGGVLALPDRLALGSMALLVLSELVLVPATQAASTLMLALGRGALGSAIVCVVPVLRLVAVGALVALDPQVASTSVAIVHVFASMAGCAVVLGVVRHVVGRADWSARPSVRDMLVRGKAYALGMLVGTAYTEVDKVLLLQLAGAMAAGLYTTAFRVAAVLAIPVIALASNVLPRLFAAAGTPGWGHMFRAVVAAAAAYAVGVSVAVFLLADSLPLVFGADYRPSVGILRLLCPWIVLYAAHMVLAAALTSLGRQRARVVVEAVGLCVVLAVDVALIPSLGARGAAYALLAADAAVVAMATVLLLRPKDQPRPQTR